MFAVLLASYATAAEVQITTTVPVQVLVDGRAVVWNDHTGIGSATGLPAGTHVIETRNTVGKTTAYKEIHLAANEGVRFEYRRRELWHAGTYAIGTPIAPQTGIEIAVDGVQVGVHIDASSSVSVGHHAGAHIPTGPPIITIAAPPIATAPQGMEPAAFAGLLQQLNNASFSDDKLQVLRTAMAYNPIQCAQLAQVLDQFSFSNDKLAAVQIARTSVIDPQNAFLLNDRFSFSGDAQKAQQMFL